MSWLWRDNAEALLRLTKKSILDLSTTAMVPGGAIGGALGGMVRQNWTFHLSCAAWSGNCRERREFIISYLSNTEAIPSVLYKRQINASRY